MTDLLDETPEMPEATPQPMTPPTGWSQLWKHEDYMAIWCGFAILITCLVATLPQLKETEYLAQNMEGITARKHRANELRLAISKETDPDKKHQMQLRYQLLGESIKKQQSNVFPHPFKNYSSKLEKWTTTPLYALGIKYSVGKNGTIFDPGIKSLTALLVTYMCAAGLFAVALTLMGEGAAEFLPAFTAMFGLSILAAILSKQAVIQDYNLEYPLWALLVGAIISNTIGTPQWLRPAVKTELYIKTGLVLLGATVLLPKLFALSLPGIMVAWVVTPIVLITTYWFGQRILKIESKSLNMTICADMSVCGVSAAIATGAACKAKRDEISLAIALSLTFTVLMMIVQPWIIREVGMSDVLGGAWIGGTIDATGAVAAAGAFLGPDGELVAVTVKMIQNILIGVIAFGVAVYWVTVVENDPTQPRPSISEIWTRFPKFILGFVAASALFSILSKAIPSGDLMVSSVTGITDTYRTWFFTLAFVSIGLEASIKELAAPLKSGKPLVLYVCGQTLNLGLTLAMAWLMFEVLFPDMLVRLNQ
jgi:uncharacterized membrane protein YadS